MSEAQAIGAFVVRARQEDLSAPVRRQLKMHILDTLGCALNVIGEGPTLATRAQVDEFGGTGPCTLIGGGSASPPYAAFYNTTLTRYLDFMDNYLGLSETCHPCDSFASVLAAAEYAGGSGNDLLTALAVAYQVQCRLTGAAPIMQKGFDHTTQLSFAIAAGVAKALGMTAEQATNGVAIAGAENLALAVIRAVPISQWKGLGSSQTALSSVHAAFLARRGVTGPPNVFEGPKGFDGAIGSMVNVDWASEGLDIITQTLLKSYNSEVHTQPTVYCMLELRARTPFAAGDVAHIEVETFKLAYDIVGGGEYGPKTEVATKEQADHSIPYILAAAILDGDVQPAQFAADRIVRDDVQQLLRKVSVRPDAEFTARYPGEMNSRVSVRLTDGRTLTHHVVDYPGFPTKPFTWEQTVGKFNTLGAPHANGALRAEIVDAVDRLEEITVADLTTLLARAHA